MNDSQPKQLVGETAKSTHVESAETVLDPIRTEDVFSRFPLHQLSKKKADSFDIRIIRKDKSGKTDFYWKVDPHPQAGIPGQLAYKFDTLVVNRRFDEIGRPIPRIVRLGSLRSIARELGLGTNTTVVKQMIEQNARLWIHAKFGYTTAVGRNEFIEAGFNRYSYAIRGSKLPNGETADVVYLLLNDPYHLVLNTSKLRPLDYAYLKELTPAAQRFYQLVSPNIYAALKTGSGRARIRYSEYCTFAPQKRLFQRHLMQTQMGAVHRVHKRAGYITSAKYIPTQDEQGNADWLLEYTPGPRARAEFQFFNLPRARQPRDPNQPDRAFLEQKKAVDEELLKELVKRGVPERLARRKLSDLPPDQDVRVQIDWADQVVAADPTRVKNPVGLLLSFITDGVQPPAGFETSQQRAEKQERARARDEERARQTKLKTAYEAYRQQAVAQHIAALDPSEFAARIEARLEGLERKSPAFNSWKPEDRRKIAQSAVSNEIEATLTLIDFTTFCEREKGSGTT